MATAIARAINEKQPRTVDVNVVIAGALLHELGTIRSSGIGYIAQGVQLAEMLLLDLRVVEVIRRHKGAGIGWGDAKLIGFPLPLLVPIELEEQIVSLADLQVRGNHRYYTSDILRKMSASGRWDYVNGVKALQWRLSHLAGRDIDGIGPRQEVTFLFAEDPTKGMTIDPGRLVAEEDDWTFERQRRFFRTMSKQLAVATLIIGLTFGLLLSVVSAAPTSEGGGHSFCYLSLFLPGLTLVLTMSFLYAYHQTQPVRVYENGLAFKASRSGEYQFWPWASWYNYRFHDHFRLGPVMTIDGGTRSVRLLGTMRSFARVERLLKEKMIPSFE